MYKKRNKALLSAVESLGSQIEVAPQIGMSQGNLSDCIYYRKSLAVISAIRLSLLTNLKYKPEELDPTHDYEPMYEFFEKLKRGKNVK